MLGGNEFRLRQGFACGKTLVRRKRADPPCGAPVLSGIYSLRTRQKERHAEKRVFLFGFRQPKAASTLRSFKCSGSAKPPLRNSPLRSEFTPHSRRGPEGPSEDLAAASILYGQDKKKHQPVGWCFFLDTWRFLKCSAEMNSASAEVLACGQNARTAQKRRPAVRGPSFGWHPYSLHRTKSEARCKVRLTFCILTNCLCRMAAAERQFLLSRERHLKTPRRHL